MDEISRDLPLMFAHSTTNSGRSDWQPLRSHLENVGRMAKERAAIFGAHTLAETSGLLHDLGKYTADFQRRLAGDAIRVDHATRGAMVAIERYGPLGYLIAYAIAGHHAGLANGLESGERTALRERLRGTGLPPLLPQWQDEIRLPEALGELPFTGGAAGGAMFQAAFLIRMLFSCLVDADYLDTEAFYDRIAPPDQRGDRSRLRAVEQPSLEALRESLDASLARFSADSDVNRIRADILAHVRNGAQHTPGLFSLTVPTGGGKTLASLAFALDHAIRHNLRRVIFVIPFTSIVEQNAAVFRRALGELGETSVLEHHSAFIAPQLSRDDAERYQAQEKLSLSMENWDAPIVVTTAVQFFESLFAARPSQCRKLHNIAGSVVILDEAQTLPLKLLRPAVAAIDELARNYRSSVVLCTATQPALQAPEFVGGLERVRELAPEPPALFRKLKRVRVKHVGELDDEALTDRMRAHEQVLCIVNNRRHARAVFQTMSDLVGARHLTTLMCARHRSEVLAGVREDLRQGRSCRLVSTSLIEAGVDVDFPLVLRAQAGLDSIAQAAGRCNREGRRAVAASEVLVFSTANPDWAPPPELKQFAQAASTVLRSHTNDPLSPAAIQAYFRELYWQKGSAALDCTDLLGLLQRSRPDSLPMETLAARFRMIESVQMPVIVPFDKVAREALQALRFADKSSGLARRLQSYLVQLPRQGFEALRKSGAIQPVAPERWGEQFMELTVMDLYDECFGLSWDDPAFLSSESLMW
ncbi:CRISPR-associated helicase/endonuclease Cas3 [Thauera aromatica]|uniref:CRISPR-associated helicase Cas3 n=1 Tax=Thauera aromatica K172 TaxID=44139 RepID=A0A2R4BRD6_THAAR|nr:CRISPR-associated helicase/endonuclease Cas3 [Thauera aromatica]AVR89899.1 CRISPR-associated helicase Cas3 [Thauera aromatica K172]